MPHRCIRRHYQRLMEFDRGHIVGLLEAGWSYDAIRKQRLYDSLPHRITACIQARGGATPY
uniref:Uncharacterized protein n=1 Tax=Paramormyrops kingsleyae TaxID=1676925 RepID=A0A3B3QNC1_9TELE